MEQNAKIYISGHQGMVGSAICNRLKKSGYNNLLVATRQQLNLTRQNRVEEFVKDNRPDYMIIAAARVGGIHANSQYPAEFIRDNLQININLIEAARLAKVKKLLFLGSSCIYPKLAEQPIVEESLLSGPLEPSNQWYAIAKISGIKLCQAYREQYNFNAISAMPTNLYGPKDNFHDENSHVIPALINRFHTAKQNNSTSITAWGSGSPKREFLHVDDLADAVLYLLKNYDQIQPINVGVGRDISIKELTELVAQVVGYNGKIEWDRTKQDGTPRKLLDVSRINKLGWKAKKPLKDGLTETYAWFCEQSVDNIRCK
ncbi:MAG: GDP-L-fucose synthase [Magnetococcales bacterium]|nr:GDP-L-fucose synthase [Magnetococcales bacterium]